jgi:hypothetical protein
MIPLPNDETTPPVTKIYFVVSATIVKNLYELFYKGAKVQKKERDLPDASKK